MELDCNKFNYFETNFLDEACLVCYLSNGHIIAYSLPSLNILIDVEFLPVSELKFVYLTFSEILFEKPLCAISFYKITCVFHISAKVMIIFSNNSILVSRHVIGKVLLILCYLFGVNK